MSAKSQAAGLPAVPLTIEGSWMLHQIFHLRRDAWRELSDAARAIAREDFWAALKAMSETANQAGGAVGQTAQPSAPRDSEKQISQSHDAAEAPRSRTQVEPQGGHAAGGTQIGYGASGSQASSTQSAAFSVLGHKGDLILVHFRESFAQLGEVERQLARLTLSRYLEPATSYVSVVELGLYESTAKTYRELAEKKIEPHSEEWAAAIAQVLERQREAMRPRLYPGIPDGKAICFYPMNRRRGEEKNWYMLPLEERQRQMHEHGMVGRRYAGRVRQIISGSIGFDDWEWGVDLIADDPLVFKHLIYEMRFDEVSALYAEFGTFYVGERLTEESFKGLLA